jgi:hypothetical protein
MAGMAGHGSAGGRHGTTQRGMARLGRAWQGMAGSAWHSWVRLGSAWQGRFGIAGRGLARHGRHRHQKGAAFG